MLTCRLVRACHVIAAVTGIQPPFAAWNGGSLITIQGRGLGSGTEVTAATLGGIAANIVSQSMTTVVVRTLTVSSNIQGRAVLRTRRSGTLSSDMLFQYAGGTFAFVFAFDFSAHHRTRSVCADTPCVRCDSARDGDGAV